MHRYPGLLGVKGSHITSTGGKAGSTKLRKFDVEIAPHHIVIKKYNKSRVSMGGSVKVVHYALRDAFFDDRAQLDIDAYPLYFRGVPSTDEHGAAASTAESAQPDLLTLYCASSEQRAELLDRFQSVKQSDKRARLASARSEDSSWASPAASADGRSGSASSRAGKTPIISAPSMNTPGAGGAGAARGAGLPHRGAGAQQLPSTPGTPFKNPYSAGPRRGAAQNRGPVVVRGGIAHTHDDVDTVAMSQVGTLVGSDGSTVTLGHTENDAGSVMTTMTLPAPPATPAGMPPAPVTPSSGTPSGAGGRSGIRSASPGLHSIGTPPIPRAIAGAGSGAGGSATAAALHTHGIAGSRRRSVDADIRTPSTGTMRRRGSESTPGSTPGSKQSDWAHTRSTSRQRTPGVRLEVADVCKLPPLEEPDTDPLRKAWPPLQELLETERSYVLHLQILQREYVDGLRKVAERGTRLPDAGQQMVMFSNAAAILDVNGELLQRFDAAIRGVRQNWTPDLPGLLAQEYMTVAPFMKIYAMYGGNYRAALAAVRVAGHQYSEFANFIKLTDAKVSAANPGLSLSSLLIKPVQRVCKYPLLWREVLKALPQDAPQRAQVESALRAAEKSADDVNQRMAASDARAQVTAVFTLLEGSIPDLVQPNRSLVADWRGQLASTDVHNATALGRRTDKIKVKTRRVFLFSDLVVVAHLRSGEESGDINAETDSGGPRYKVGACFPLDKVKLIPGYGQARPTTTGPPSVGPGSEAAAPSPGSSPPDRSALPSVAESSSPLPDARSSILSGVSESGASEAGASVVVRPRTLARHTSSSASVSAVNVGTGLGPGGSDLYGFSFRGVSYNSGTGRKGEGVSVDTITLWYSRASARDAAFDTMQDTVSKSRAISQSLTERQSRAGMGATPSHSKRRTFGSLNRSLGGLAAGSTPAAGGDDRRNALSALSNKYSTLERGRGVARAKRGSGASSSGPGSSGGDGESSAVRSTSARMRARAEESDSSEADAYRRAGVTVELQEKLAAGPLASRKPTRTKALLLQHRRARKD